MKLSPIRLVFCAYAYNLTAVTRAIPMARVLGKIEAWGDIGRYRVSPRRGLLVEFNDSEERGKGGLRASHTAEYAVEISSCRQTAFSAWLTAVTTLRIDHRLMIC